MKNIKQNITNLILFLAVLLASQSASAFYDPSTGRWLSREPIGEPGFQALQRVRASSPTGSATSASRRWINRDRPDNENRYLFVDNNPVSHIDPLGLIKFEGCDGREEEIKQAFGDFCKKVNDPQFASCLGCNLGARTIVARLKNRCSNPDDSLHGIKVKCEQSDSGLCGGACAWSLPGGDTIHICPQQWSNAGCGKPGCTLMHELTHMAGHPSEKWPGKVEDCLGCK